MRMFYCTITMIILTLSNITKDETDATTTTRLLPFERNRENIGLHYLEALAEASS